SGSASTTIKRPLVSISKSVDKANAPDLDTLTYTVVTSNDGNGSTAYDTRVVDHLAANTTYVSGSATTGAGITTEYSANGMMWFSTEAGAGGASAIRHIRWTIASLAAGATQNLGFKATINYPTATGTSLTNSATNDQYCNAPSSTSGRNCYTGQTSTATT